MRTFLVVLALLAAIAAAGCFVVLELYAKAKYDRARRSDYVAYAVTPMDARSTAFLARVQSDWKCAFDVTNGPDADALKLAGKSLSVSNIISVYNYRMPQYSWFLPWDNHKAAKLNLIKVKFMPVSLDKEWHVSEDEHLAFLICMSNVVYVWQDEPSGLRATLYYVKRKHPVAPPNNALEPTATTQGS